MRAVPIDTFEGKRVNKISAINRIKHLVQKMVKALSYDAGPVFKSREWPYL